MKYLVTGGAGFIGSHIADALLKEGHEVLILDNLSTGKRRNIPEAAIFIEKDFTSLDDIRTHFEGVEGVFHPGALPRVPFAIENPVDSFKANVTGTLNVLVAARDAGVKRVIYSASSSAYGDQQEMPLRPDMRANPMNPYALQKYVNELTMKQFFSIYGMETVSLRYFNVYGPRMADTGAYVSVISHFARQKKAGEPLTIHGDGEQTRDFTYVSDVVDANLRAMRSEKVGQGDVLNVGAGNNWSVNYIAKAVGGSIAQQEGRSAEARDSLADISLTREKLGWEPKVQFPDGLRDTLRGLGIDPLD